MGTMAGWETRRKNHLKAQEKTAMLHYEDGVAAERARIRRELLESPELRRQDISIGRVVALIDRICSEEKQ